MKLFRRKDKKRKKITQDEGRSVVFIDRTKKVSVTNHSSRRGMFVVKKILKRIGLLLFLLSITASVLYLLFSTNLDSGEFVSPMASKSTSPTNELEEKIIQELRKNNIEYKKVTTLENSDYQIILKENNEVLLSGNKDIIEQIASLQFILNRLTMEGSNSFKKLDLRFEKPVVISQ